MLSSRISCFTPCFGGHQIARCASDFSQPVPVVHRPGSTSGRSPKEKPFFFRPARFFICIFFELTVISCCYRQWPSCARKRKCSNRNQLAPKCACRYHCPGHGTRDQG